MNTVNAKYKAILFDLDGTLIDFYACETNALRKAFVSAGFEIDSETSWARIWNTYESISSHYWNRRVEDNLSRNQVVEYSVRDTLITLGENRLLASIIAQDYWDIFCHTAYLNPGAREILEKLSGYYKLGLVTNGYSRAQRGRLQAGGLHTYFASVVISDEVGYAKPSREIFDIALSELAVPYGEALYVGDSIEHDYRGAGNAGIDFCYYQPDEKKDVGFCPKFRVSSLAELEYILLNDAIQ